MKLLRPMAGPLKLKDALDFAIQTAHGLEAAHEKEIVHRDIKPANLMITGTGSKQLVTIMDFGLALLTDRSKLTRLDETIGLSSIRSTADADSASHGYQFLVDVSPFADATGFSLGMRR